MQTTEICTWVLILSVAPAAWAAKPPAKDPHGPASKTPQKQRQPGPDTAGHKPHKHPRHADNDRDFKPSERIDAGQSVAFPANI